MSVQRPAASLALGSQTLEAPAAALVELRVDLGLGGAHDRFRALVGSASPAADTEVGADATVELGYDESLTTVLTGSVSAVERLERGVLVEGLSATSALSTARVGRSYLSQSVDAVVRDLVSSGGGTAGEVTAAGDLAAYHVDERRSVWSHLRALSLLAGCELSSDAEGQLVVRPPKGAPVADHRLRRGAELISWYVGPRAASGEAPDVVPFGAASEQGAEKWHIVLREPDGGSPSTATLVPAAVRDRAGAKTYADALGKAVSRRASGGTIVAVGDASIRAGDLVQLQGVDGVDDLLRATAVTHLLDRDGFRTTLRVEAAG
ncbi:MAG TPA: hypothetical protein VGF23_21940 [Gaiellaceae bacterium]|jgi:hypothetical protein